MAPANDPSETVPTDIRSKVEPTDIRSKAVLTGDPLRVLVVGDFHVDLLLGPVPPDKPSVTPNPNPSPIRPCLSHQRIGGANLMFHILDQATLREVTPKIASPLPKPQIERCLTIKKKTGKCCYVKEADLANHESEIETALPKIITLLKPIRGKRKQDKPIARVDKVLGEVNPVFSWDNLDFLGQKPPKDLDEPPKAADVLVIRDANRGFRDLNPAD